MFNFKLLIEQALFTIIFLIQPQEPQQSNNLI